MADHVHIMLSIPPKYSVAQVIGYIKGKSAIHIARHFAGRPRNFVGQHFWARGYFVSTVGRDEQAIRTYIRDQEQEERPRTACMDPCRLVVLTDIRISAVEQILFLVETILEQRAA